MDEVLSIRGLHKRVGSPARSLLTGVDLNVAPGQMVAVCGRSGSGKSTLLHLCGGLDTDYQGAITVVGHDLAGMTDGQRSDLRLHHVGMVFQAFHLVEHVSLRDNVMLPARFVARGKRASLAQRAQILLEAVGLGHRSADLPTILSGGERQRVAIARALLMQPRVLLADEPTGNLDPQTAAGVLDLFLGLVADHQAACILVTHESAVAARAHRQVWLQDGVLVPSVEPA